MRGDTSDRVAGGLAFGGLASGGLASGGLAPGGVSADALAVETLAARARAGERALHAERGRLVTLVETLRDGILLLDADQRVTAVNETFRRLVRVASPGTDLEWGRLLSALQPALVDGAEPVRRLRDAVDRPVALVGEEIAFDDGRVVELDVVPVERDGQRTGTVVQARDVTARVAVSRGLAARTEALAEATALNNEFVATVAHELRGPLSSVVAFAHLLGDADAGPLTEDQRSYLSVIDRNANRLLRVIEDLLLLTRLESRTLTLRPGPVQVADLLDAVLVERRPAAEGSGVALVADLVDGPTLVCDETRVHQLVGNLVGNALTFTPAGGRVTVQARPAGDSWRIDVVDDGIGIPAAELPRLFRPFFRASNAASAPGRPAVPGTGLGLVISRAIVELHGGTIHVASTEGAGTTVTVTLPARTRTKDGG